MKKKYLKYNINHGVKVKLTEHGQNIILEQQEQFRSKHPEIASAITSPKPDKDGWTTWQMWSLMSAFGDAIGLTSDIPFETDVLIEVVEEDIVIPKKLPSSDLLTLNLKWQWMMEYCRVNGQSPSNHFFWQAAENKFMEELSKIQKQSDQTVAE